MKNIIPPNTEIRTGNTGVLAICDCDQQRASDRLVAHGADYYVDDDGEKVPIEPSDRSLVYITREGNCTGWYATGSKGVSDEDAEAAEIDDEPFCEECGDYIRGWIRTADE